MPELTTITAREANHRFAELLSTVEKEGRGFVVTKRGRPVARLVPVETEDRLTPERRAALECLLATHWNLGIDLPDRDELHER
ncbi:MAG TPA: type II toxin-antitoxin system Phd/YefM family antitoxin [Geminicoccaceae bacterium]|nr:type II toxin-antitoxin system Phd/YefM family antitoxin [Geminicoccaceae bacterium]